MYCTSKRERESEVLLGATCRPLVAEMEKDAAGSWLSTQEPSQSVGGYSGWEVCSLFEFSFFFLLADLSCSIHLSRKSRKEPVMDSRRVDLYFGAREKAIHLKLEVAACYIPFIERGGRQGGWIPSCSSRRFSGQNRLYSRTFLDSLALQPKSSPFCCCCVTDCIYRTLCPNLE